MGYQSKAALNLRGRCLQTPSGDAALQEGLHYTIVSDHSLVEIGLRFFWYFPLTNDITNKVMQVYLALVRRESIT